MRFLTINKLPKDFSIFTQFRLNILSFPNLLPISRKSLFDFVKILIRSQKYKKINMISRSLKY